MQHRGDNMGNIRIGQRFGRLVVVEKAHKDKWNDVFWKCICDCGNEKVIRGRNMSENRTKSCGCLSKELLIERNKSPEGRQKVSEATTGERNPMYGRRGENNPNFGKKCPEHSERMKGYNPSEETRKKISEGKRGKNNPMYGMRKELSPSYNPSISDIDRQDRRAYPEYDEWRINVYKRDNYTCQCCGDSKGGNLNAHHLEAYRNNPDMRTLLENGLTLCEECHVDFHRQYGYGNNTNEQFEEFMRGQS